MKVVLERSLIFCTCAALALAGCESKPDDDGGDRPTLNQKGRTESPWFEEVAKAAGLDFVHERGPLRYWFPELVSGGAALFDYDGDEDLDLYLVQAGDLDPAAKDVPGNRLYRNRGDGTFEDVTQAAGVGDTGYGMGCSFGDTDGDGDLDLYVTNYGPNVLYRNNGDGTFTDVTKDAGVGKGGWSSSSAFVDVDADGDLDLYLVNYVSWTIETEIKCYDSAGRQDYCKPANYNAPSVDTLYRNDGNGRFTDVSEQAGIQTAFGSGLGVCCGDFNLDGRIDIYVANDGMPNQLWMNTGPCTFSDESLIAGCAVNMMGTAEAGMGVAAVDLEHDGDLDLFMTHLRNETNTLYINEGGLFKDSTPGSGLSRPSVQYTGFGMGFADFNHDGNLDLFIANGRVGLDQPTWGQPDPYCEPNLLLRGLGKGRFEEILPTGGTADLLLGTSRAAAFGDVDGDGDTDVVIVECGGPVRLLRNVAADGNWIMFRVRDRRGFDAIGAQLMIDNDGPRTRLVQTAYSYCAGNDPRVHFGLGKLESVAKVTVRWVNGKKEQFGPFEANQVVELVEGKGK